MSDKHKVTIDGIPVEVDPGTSILNAARQIGGDIVPPAMCYYSKLQGSGGKCRTCLVKVSKGSEKDPRPMPKLVASCRTAVMDGMEVQNITSPEVIEAARERKLRLITVGYKGDGAGEGIAVSASAIARSGAAGEFACSVSTCLLSLRSWLRINFPKKNIIRSIRKKSIRSRASSAKSARAR